VNTGDTEFYATDRFFGIGQTADGVFSIAQSSVAPDGFRNSTLCTVTTADSSIGASQFYLFSQKIEGFNIADLMWGTASAQPVTLSFWVRSSLTGTFGGSLRNSDANRSYPFSYVISSANTWEYKTITVAGDTTGGWVTDNGIGIRLAWSLGDGSSRLGTAGAWTSNNNSGVTGQVNLIATSGATFYITGVQLEEGTAASPFENRLYGTELVLCQRYYQQSKASLSVADSSTGVRGMIPLRVQLRAEPSLGKTSGSFKFGDMVSYAGTSSNTPTIGETNNDLHVSFNLGGMSGMTTYRTYKHETDPSFTALFTMSAEL
jgi:hypothetical protein